MAFSPGGLALLIASLGTATACGGKEGWVGIGDVPAVSTHTSQQDIDDGGLDLKALIERGKVLMDASFNTLDGAGRPGEHRDR